MCDDEYNHVATEYWEDGVMTPESYELNDYNAFRTMLNITRDQDRQEYVCKALNPPHIIIHPPSEEEKCKTDSGSHASTIALARETLLANKKKREGAKKTYREFLNYKHNEVQKTRLQEFRQSGVPSEKLPEKISKHYSLDEPKRKIDENQRRNTFGGENYFDKTISSLVVESDEPEVEEKEEKRQSDVEWAEPEKPLQPILNPKIESLVEDQYFPGFIDDAVNGKIDFNQIAFHVTFSGEKVPLEEPATEEVPISLIEAFDLRVQREQSKLEKSIKQERTPAPKKGKNFVQYLKDNGINIHCREETVLANAVEIDVANIMKNRPMTGLTKAISCLQRAEIMNDFDKSFQAAEQAFESASPEMAESAAIYKAKTFKAEELLKKKILLPPEANYRPIEIVSYLGITKPIDPIVKCDIENKL